MAGQQLRSRRIKLRNFENVIAGQTARLEITDGFLFKALFLAFSGVTLAQMKQIRIKANDEVIYRASAAFFDVLSFFENYPDSATAGYLAIPFVRYDLKNVNAEALTGLNVNSVDAEGRVISRIVVEIDIDAAAAAPVIVPYAEVSDALIGAGPGYIRRIYDYTKSPIIQGKNDIANFANIGQQVSTRLYLNRAWFGIDPADVDEVTVHINRREADRFTPVLNEVMQKRNRRQPVAGYISLDPTATGLGGNWFPLSADLEEFRVELDINTAPAFLPYFAEYIGALS